MISETACYDASEFRQVHKNKTKIDVAITSVIVWIFLMVFINYSDIIINWLISNLSSWWFLICFISVIYFLLCGFFVWAI